MIVAGVDVGSLSAEAVIMEDDRILGFEIINVRPTPLKSSTEVMEKALAKTRVRMADVDCCVSTGYGRDKIPFSQKSLTEISCHGKGAHWCDPGVRGIIDIGGQDCKAIVLDRNGDIDDFVMNDKCAAGTGRFLEIIAKVLEVDVSRLGRLSFESHSPLDISSRCSVFAEYEAIFSLAEGKDLADIGAGANRSMAQRAFSLASKIRLNPDIGGLTVTGGVAKNIGVMSELRKLLGAEIVTLSQDPQIIGALGAAIFAREHCLKEK